MRWTEGGQPDLLGFAGLRGGGKGGSTNSSSNSYSSGTSTTVLPDWVTSASQGALANAQALAATPYQAYTGQMVADPTAATNQAYSQIYNMQGMNAPAWNAVANTYSGLLGQAQPLTTQQIQGLTNQLYGGYGQNVIAPSAGLLSGYMQGPATANQVASNAMTLMSPYEQAVINPSMKAGQQMLAQNLQQIGAGANQAGAFGGSRQGVMEGVAQAQTSLGESQQIASLLNSGWQASLTPAAQLALQGGQQGYGAANTLAGLISGGYGTEQQAATGLANTNLGLGMTAAQQLPGALTADQSATAQQIGLLQQAGTAQQQQQQNIDTAAYGQYLAAQQYPYQQLDTVLSALGAVPYGTTTSYSGYNMGSGKTSYTPSLMSQIGQGVGAATSLLGMF